MPCFRLFLATVAALLEPLISFAAVPENQRVDLRVIIEGSLEAEAPFYFALYDDPDAFESQEDGIHMTVLNHWIDRPSVAFTDLAPGRYVVAVFQDINGNGELDTNILGQPVEPYALSGNATVPRFEDAAISIDTDSQSISLELRQ